MLDWINDDKNEIHNSEEQDNSPYIFSTTATC